MSEELISFCGINCVECPAYVAKRTNDNELREKTAKAWSGPEGQLSTNEINCDGCISFDQEQFNFCKQCQVRKCGIEKKVENCAYCDDYICEKLEGIWNMISSTEPRDTLNSIRANIK